MRQAPRQIQEPRYRGDSRSIIISVDDSNDPTSYTWSLTAQTTQVTSGGAVLFTLSGATVAGSQLVTFAMTTADALTMTADTTVIYEISAMSGTQVVSRIQAVQQILESEVPPTA